MKNTSKKTKTKKATSKKTNNLRIVLGKEIPKNARNEIKLIVEAIASLGNRKNVTFQDVLTKTKTLRNTAKFNLIPFDKLSEGSKRNFINRIAKTLGGTKISANLSNSIQGKYFNIEVLTDFKVNFKEPIDYSKAISKQVKNNTFAIVGRGEIKTNEIKKSKTLDAQTKKYQAQFQTA